MREIKLRAWNKQYKQMLYAYEPEEQGKREYYPFVFLMGFSHYDSSALEIMQWTGLKDRQGDEIYEHDLVIWDGGQYTVIFSETEGGLDTQR